MLAEVTKKNNTRRVTHLHEGLANPLWRALAGWVKCGVRSSRVSLTQYKTIKHEETKRRHN